MGSCSSGRKTKVKALGACLLLITLLSVAMPVGADSVFLGTVAADQPITLNIDNSATGGAKTIVRVNYYLTGGRPSTKVDILVVPGGARQTFVQAIPRGTRAIAFELATAAFSSIPLEFLQGEFSSFYWTCVGGCTLMFDLP